MGQPENGESPGIPGLSEERLKGLEPSTFCMQSRSWGSDMRFIPANLLFQSSVLGANLTGSGLESHGSRSQFVAPVRARRLFPPPYLPTSAEPRGSVKVQSDRTGRRPSPSDAFDGFPRWSYLGPRSCELAMTSGSRGGWATARTAVCGRPQLARAAGGRALIVVKNMLTAN